MQMKRKILITLGRAVLFILHTFDWLFTGSVSGRTRDEQTQDPYIGFKLLRSRGGVLRSYVNRGWMAVGFEEAQAIFLDSERFGSDIRKNKFLSRVIRAASGDRKVSLLDDPTMLSLDPPDHTRLRKLVNQGFLHKDIMALEPRIGAIVDECLDRYDPSTGQFDIITQLAKPLPAIVIAELLGLPKKDMAVFQSLSEELLHLTAIGDDELMERGTLANEKLVEYLEEVIEQKRQSPGQDLIGRLIAAEEEGDRLTSEEMYSTCVLLLVAGHETTTRLIGTGIYTLLKHRDQFEMLKRDPGLVVNAIEEMLRYEPPVQLMPRFAKEDTVFYGKKIKKNQMIVPVIASANRDPAANDNPDDFDITRKDIRHVSFGYGIHLCLGLNLARLEARVAFNKLLARFPDMTLASDEVNWLSGSALVRGMDQLLINTDDSQAQSAA